MVLTPQHRNGCVAQLREKHHGLINHLLPKVDALHIAVLGESDALTPHGRVVTGDVVGFVAVAHAPRAAPKAAQPGPPAQAKSASGPIGSTPGMAGVFHPEASESPDSSR